MLFGSSISAQVEDPYANPRGCRAILLGAKHAICYGFFCVAFGPCRSLATRMILWIVFLQRRQSSGRCLRSALVSRASWVPWLPPYIRNSFSPFSMKLEPFSQFVTHIPKFASRTKNKYIGKLDNCITRRPCSMKPKRFSTIVVQLACYLFIYEWSLHKR